MFSTNLVRIQLEKCRSIKPVSTISFVGEYLLYWYEAGNGRQLLKLKKWSVPLEIKELYVGELDAEDLHKVCFKDQRFKRITISDAEATSNLLEVLQGQAVAPRKQFIYDNAEKLGFNFD